MKKNWEKYIKSRKPSFTTLDRKRPIPIAVTSSTLHQRAPVRLYHPVRKTSNRQALALVARGLQRIKSNRIAPEPRPRQRQSRSFRICPCSASPRLETRTEVASTTCKFRKTPNHGTGGWKSHHHMISHMVQQNYKIREDAKSWNMVRKKMPSKARG